MVMPFGAFHSILLYLILNEILTMTNEIGFIIDPYGLQL